MEATVNAILKGSYQAELLSRYPAGFSSPSSDISDFKAHVTLLLSAVPKFCIARTVPYALQDKLCVELQYLQDDRVLTLVSSSHWAMSIIVKKFSGGLHICGDFSTTVNI
ncbi:uncharacterized protein K02A2.6-like [Schistocerca cancellata]|uniref:uncharacterized protein K02A2.6-like n=1 Tax=Schistocerca cancellata TaxID=274614 RepID=UPI002118B3FF|nr:uncharacterized protein K02A2.6-like [Schistocerca cancellata]